LILFRREIINFDLKRASKTHEDFWIFLKKYEGLKRRKPTAKSSASQLTTERVVSIKYKLPLDFDKRWKFNFVYKPHKSNISSYDAHGEIQNLTRSSDFIFLNFLRK
jgi:hypothetical protein